jgi:hypothetical protein
MVPQNEPDAYRQRLIESLREHVTRRHRELPETLQLFVNHASVGRLKCQTGETLFQFRQGHRAIRTVEIRSESGLITGNLFPRDLGTSAATFRGKRYRIDVTVTNGPESGSLTLAHCRQGSALERLRDTARRLLSSASFGSAAVAADRSPSVSGLWPNVAIFAQLILAGSVLALVYAGLHGQQNEATETSAQRTLSLVEEKLATLTETEARVARLSQSLDLVASQQQQLRAQLSSVEQKIASKFRAIEARMQVAVRRSSDDDEAIRRQIQELTQAKQGMTTAMSKLERQVMPLLSREPVSKALATPEPVKPEGPKPGELSLALPPAPPQVVEAKTAASPFTFWVSFQDGTSEQTIDDLISEIHGRRGTNNSGWYSVEVTLAQPHSPDQLFQTLQKTRIVKAVSTKPSP